MQNHWKGGDESVLRLAQNGYSVVNRLIGQCREHLTSRFEQQAPAVADLVTTHVIAPLCPCKRLSFETKPTDIATHNKAAAHSRPEHTLVTGPVGCGVYCRGLE